MEVGIHDTIDYYPTFPTLYGVEKHLNLGKHAKK